MRTVFFQCKLRNFRGSHLKLWDYFGHVLTAPGFTPRITFSADTRWDATNPWLHAREYEVKDWRSLPVDVFFLGGRHWDLASRHPNWGPRTPVINFIQHVHHADATNDRFEFLSRPAIRVCVADEVKEALEQTGVVRGPVLVIPNSIDFSDLPSPRDEPPAVDLLIAALKRPDLGRTLQRRLERSGRRIRLLTDRLPRTDYLRELQAADVTVFLPNNTEGFYLPALEGLAVGTTVVCPDCIGNRSFCLPEVNAFRPAFTLDAIVDATERALAQSSDDARRMRHNARETAERYSLQGERAAFHRVLGNVDRLWQEALADEPAVAMVAR